MPQNDNLTPGQYIAKRRQVLGLTQAEFAGRLTGGDITSSFIGMMESRRSNVPLRRSIEIAAALEVEPLWFVMLVMRAQMPQIAQVISKAIVTPDSPVRG